MAKHSIKIKAQRWYLHGDESMELLNKYYCSKCDLFESFNHFLDSRHVNENKKRFSIGMQHWQEFYKNNGYVRPSNSINIIARLPKPETSSFYKWIIKQDLRDDVIGDLAKDILRDDDFPKAEQNYQNIEGYLLQKCFDVNDAIEALYKAFQEYQPKNKNRIGISPSIRFDVFKRDNYCCQICGANVKDDSTVKLEVDHKTPVKHGGTNSFDNLWTLCFKCNRGKSTKTLFKEN